MPGTFTDHFIQRFRFIFMALMSTEFTTELNPARTAYSIPNPFKSRAQLILRFFFFVFTMKRSATSASNIEVEPEPEGEVKRKVVYLKTFQKWHTEMDRELKTISWLCSSEAIKNGKKIVKELFVRSFVSRLCVEGTSVIIGSLGLPSEPVTFVITQRAINICTQ